MLADVPADALVHGLEGVGQGADPDQQFVLVDGGLQEGEASEDSNIGYFCKVSLVVVAKR